MTFTCKQCKKSVQRIKRYTFCSQDCYHVSRIGHPVSEHTRELIRQAHLGRKATSEQRARMSAAFMGRRISEEHKKKLSIAFSGSKCHLWRGGITKEHQRIRTGLDYRLWRASVFERDKYTCQDCGAHGVKLNADHIKSFALYPELRFELSNGRTLCVPCHRNTGTFGSHGRVLVEQTKRITKT